MHIMKIVHLCSTHAVSFAKENTHTHTHTRIKKNKKRNYTWIWNYPPCLLCLHESEVCNKKVEMRGLTQTHTKARMRAHTPSLRLHMCVCVTLYLKTHTHTHTHTMYWPGIKESGAQDHDSLAGALLELHLDGAELAVDDAHHALDLLGRDGPRARLFPQQVHHMGGELVARLPRGRLEKNKQSPQLLFTFCERENRKWRWKAIEDIF